MHLKNTHIKRLFRSANRLMILGLATWCCNTAMAKPVSFIVNSNLQTTQYPDNSEPGIYKISFDTQTPSNYQLTRLIEIEQPSYMTVQADGKILVSTGNQSAGVAIYEPDEQGHYSLQTQLMDIGNNACHVSYNQAYGLISLAFYASPFTKLLQYNDLTQSLNEFQKFTHQGQGVHPRQGEPHPHWSGWSPEGQFLYAVDLGIDEVKQYYQESGQWLSKTAAKLAPGDGPRHMAFHPTKHFVYLLNELSNTLVVYQQNLATGELTQLQKLSTLKPDFNEHSQAAAVRVSNDGRFVYASNRGEDTIAVFEVQASGQLKHIQSAESGDHWPRDFNFSADQDFILVANTRGDKLSLLKRDINTGLLTDTGIDYPIATPKFISAGLASF